MHYIRPPSLYFVSRAHFLSLYLACCTPSSSSSSSSISPRLSLSPCSISHYTSARSPSPASLDSRWTHRASAQWLCLSVQQNCKGGTDETAWCSQWVEPGPRLLWRTRHPAIATELRADFENCNVNAADQLSKPQKKCQSENACVTLAALAYPHCKSSSQTLNLC